MKKPVKAVNVELMLQGDLLNKLKTIADTAFTTPAVVAQVILAIDFHREPKAKKK